MLAHFWGGFFCLFFFWGVTIQNNSSLGFALLSISGSSEKEQEGFECDLLLLFLFFPKFLYGEASNVYFLHDLFKRVLWWLPLSWNFFLSKDNLNSCNTIFWFLLFTFWKDRFHIFCQTCGWCKGFFIVIKCKICYVIVTGSQYTFHCFSLLEFQ